MDPRLPPLEGFGARIAFTRKSVSVTDGRARLAGNPLSFEVSNQKDGGLGVNVAGTLDVSQLRKLSKHSALQFVEGQTEWRGNIVIRDKIATLKVDSNLVGIGSTLPAPFAKAAGASLPLRLEVRERPGRQRVLAVDLGTVASARLLLDSADSDGVRRGMVSLGAVASLPATDGLWVNGNLDVVDVDAWRPIFAAAAGETSIDVAGADLKIAILDVNRRRFHDLSVNATRTERGMAGRAFRARNRRSIVMGICKRRPSVRVPAAVHASAANHHPRGRCAGQLFGRALAVDRSGR